MVKFKSLLLVLVLILDKKEKAFSKGIFYDYINPLSNLMLAIGAIIALLSAIKIYKQWSTGQSETYEGVTNWLLGCLMLIISGVALKLLYIKS